ncbi:HWE histidine kinase domain-containing protein [Falsiroseomonas sp. HW251]|uniref:HWE histidine kinase domain-containing protein n=1 Tax=Falsiroseomonas sp. HW251 TaxID=3390998 RepID=UPI003D3131A4
MSAPVLWTLGAAATLAVLTGLLLRVWGRRVAREMAEERAIVAALQAQRDAQRTAKAAAEAQRTLLLHEVNHRARNALSIVQALVRMSAPRGSAGAAEINGRIAALASAHELLASRDWLGTDMMALAAGVLAPFRGRGLALRGEPLPVPPAQVQPLSMVLHELATNAAKHGALSAGGVVELSWHITEEELLLRWAEQGGPPVPGLPRRRGVGTRVIDTLVEAQLRGRLRRDWNERGLRVEIAVPTRAAPPLAPPAGAAAIAGMPAPEPGARQRLSL